jgi:hypothetical protein
MVRIHHLPPPAKTSRELGFPRAPGRFLLVPPWVSVCHRRPLCSSGYGHMADSVRAGAAVRGTACLAPGPAIPARAKIIGSRSLGPARDVRVPVCRRACLRNSRDLAAAPSAASPTRNAAAVTLHLPGRPAGPRAKCHDGSGAARPVCFTFIRLPRAVSAAFPDPALT